MAPAGEFRSYEVIESYKTYKNVGSELKLLISFSKIEFSHETNGYYELARDIFVSGIPYLLYVKNIVVDVVGKDFDIVKQRARTVLLEEMKEKKMDLISTEVVNDSLQLKETMTKVKLLERAISILKG